MFTRNCPECTAVIEYQDAYHRDWSEKHKLICNSCSVKKANAGRWKGYVKSELKRTCPKCSSEITYTDRSNWLRASKRNSKCNKCTVRTTPESAKKISEALTGIKRSPRQSNNKKPDQEKFFRNCPKCSKQMGYVKKYNLDRANRNNALCNGCSTVVHKKSWNYVIKNSARKQMAATKAGYPTWEAYMADLDKKKKYQRKVRSLTRKQDISGLPNYDKLRGLHGTPGAYQVDHIISVREGFEKNIPPATIADITNLQIIPWKDNLTKSFSVLN